jgi:hypothetical protein
METLDVSGSDAMGSVDKTFLHPFDPFRNVGTRNYQAAIEYRETVFPPSIECVHRLVGFHFALGVRAILSAGGRGCRCGNGWGNVSPARARTITAIVC